MHTLAKFGLATVLVTLAVLSNVLVTLSALSGANAQIQGRQPKPDFLMHAALDGRAPETVGSTDRNAKSPAVAGRGFMQLPQR